MCMSIVYVILNLQKKTLLFSNIFQCILNLQCIYSNSISHCQEISLIDRIFGRVIINVHHYDIGDTMFYDNILTSINIIFGTLPLTHLTPLTS